MHGHSWSGAHVIGALALVVALAILVLVPSHRTLAAAGAAFFLVFAIKHLALATAVGIPAAGVLRHWRPRARHGAGGAIALRPDADGWLRTGEAEPHRGVLRLEHDVRALPPAGAPQGIVALDADKRMTLRFLSDVDATQLRNGLRERYARRRYGDSATVERFLSPLARPIARGEAFVITYDAAAQTTRATLGDASAVAHGQEFMQATWRLWFDDAVPAALVGALMQNLGAGRL
jgi:hypothetical protein